MGKAQQHRQAITIRFNEDDAELVEWLGQFAQASNMTKVVKLACYLLSGIQPQEGLLALMPEERFAHAAPARLHQTASTSRDINATLAAVTQEMVALRREISEQHRHRAPTPISDSAHIWPSDEGGHSAMGLPSEELTVEGSISTSSGIDMSRHRRSAPARVASSGGHPSQPTDFDPAASTRLLLETIRDFGANSQRGQR